MCTLLFLFFVKMDSRFVEQDTCLLSDKNYISLTNCLSLFVFIIQWMNNMFVPYKIPREAP